MLDDGIHNVLKKSNIFLKHIPIAEADKRTKHPVFNNLIHNAAAKVLSIGCFLVMLLQTKTSRPLLYMSSLNVNDFVSSFSPVLLIFCRQTLEL